MNQAVLEVVVTGITKYWEKEEKGVILDKEQTKRNMVAAQRLRQRIVAS